MKTQTRLKTGPLKFAKSPIWEKKKKKGIISKKFSVNTEWTHYTIYIGGIICAWSFKNKKKGGNCFSPIITLVYRRTSRELVLGLFFKTFLFLNKQFAQSVRKDSNVWILGRISQEPRPGVFLGGKNKKKGQLYLACSLEPYIMYINNLTV